MANNVTFIIQLKDQFGRVAQKVQSQFAELEAGANKARASIEKMRDKMKSVAIVGAGLTAGITAPIIATGREMIKAASDAEETANKFNEVFKGIGTQSNAAVKELTSGYNLATSSAQDLLSNTGDLLVGLGLSRDKALEVSASVVKLSADVASFKNVQGGTAQASQALTSALLGEREMLKSTFKTAVSEEDVKKRAAIMRIKDRTLTEKQSKALATLAIVTERNKDAIGDLARTQDSYANVARAHDEATKELSESMGKLLLPFAIKVTKAFTSLTNWLNTLSPGMKKFVMVLAGLAAIAGPLLLLLAGITVAFSVITLPVLAISAAILALIAVGALLIANWDSISDTLVGSWEMLKAGASDTAGWIGSKFSAAWDWIKAGAIAMVNLVIGQLNALLAPMNLVREAMGLEAMNFPTISAPTTPVGTPSGSINGQITVSAAPGARVESTKMQSSGRGLDVGVNMAMAR